MQTATVERCEPLSTVVGRNVRAWRQAHGLRQEDVYAGARLIGLGWARSSVSELESGARGLSAEELVALVLVLDEANGLQGGPSLAYLMAPPAGVRLAIGDAGLTGANVGQVLKGLPVEDESAAGISHTVGMVDGRRMQVLAAPTDDAERKAAKKLRTTPGALREAAVAAWGRRLAVERDARVTASEGSARSLQALRGHVTRELLGELSEALGAEGED